MTFQRCHDNHHNDNVLNDTRDNHLFDSSMLCVTILRHSMSNVVILSVIVFFRHYAECHSAELHNAEFHSAK